MHLDVSDLRDFYYATSLGRAAQKAMRDQLLRIWPDIQARSLAGFGFAAPLLRPYLKDAERIMTLMPAQQGVMHWPADQKNRSALVEETSWPVGNGTLDRLVVLHGLEVSERPAALLEECTRAIAVGGKAIFIVPNRSGLWARTDATPFATGRPYSLGQIEAQLGAHSFSLLSHSAALFFPPRDTPFWLRSAMMLEHAGQRISRYHAGGVLLVEVLRVDDTPRPTGLAVRARRPLRVLDGVGQPGIRPAWRGVMA